MKVLAFVRSQRVKLVNDLQMLCTIGREYKRVLVRPGSNRVLCTRPWEDGNEF